MKPLSYVVEGAASHFVDECMAVPGCIRCDEHIDRERGWVTIAQVMPRKAPLPPTLCGGVLCVTCHGAFLKWLDSAPLNGDDSG